MKRMIALLVATAFFVFGCQENSPVAIDDTEIELSKAEPNWIKLPEPVEKSLSKTYHSSEWINVDRGGIIIASSRYWTYNWWNRWNRNSEVTVDASLEIPDNAWDRSQYGRYEHISLSVNDNNVSSTFGPHMEFTKPVIFNATFTGLNLTGIDPNAINFVYQDNSGSIEQVDYDALNVDIEEGMLQIVNARIPHFSRYGFTL